MNQYSSFSRSLSKFRPSARSVSPPVNTQNPSPPPYSLTYAKPKSRSGSPLPPSRQPTEMPAYKPPGMGQAQPQERSLGTPYWPAVVPLPSYTGDRAADRQAAVAYLRSFQDRDLWALSDEEIAAYNEAGEKSWISHTDWLERAPGGSVVRHSRGHVRREPEIFSPPSFDTPSMSMYTSGQAQPRQQSFGTPYGQQSSQQRSPAGTSAGVTPPLNDGRKIRRGPVGGYADEPIQMAGPSASPQYPPYAIDYVSPQAFPAPSAAPPQTGPQYPPYAIDYVSPQAFPAPSAAPPQTSPQFDFGSVFNNYFSQLPQPRQPSFSAQTTPGFSQPAAPLPTPSFQQSTRNFDGSVTEAPNFNLRDAFIQNVNEAMLPYHMGMQSGPPQFNIQDIYSRAQGMVQGGFQNPLAALFLQ